MINLTFEQGRVLGAMIEKAMTTPANYPMSLNAVVVACNQVSNREPITEFTEGEVEIILRGLCDDGLAKMVHRPGDRVVKYRQALDDGLETSPQETALLAVLMLRGAQTPGELRQRTGRYVEFVSLAELETVLGALVERRLVERLERQPGQKESRYRELVTADSQEPVDEGREIQDVETVAPWSEETAPPALDETDTGESPARDLAQELDDLKRRFDELLQRLGEHID